METLRDKIKAAESRGASRSEIIKGLRDKGFLPEDVGLPYSEAVANAKARSKDIMPLLGLGQKPDPAPAVPRETIQMPPLMIEGPGRMAKFRPQKTASPKASAPKAPPPPSPFPVSAEEGRKIEQEGRARGFAQSKGGTGSEDSAFAAKALEFGFKTGVSIPMGLVKSVAEYGNALLQLGSVMRTGSPGIRARSKTPADELTPFVEERLEQPFGDRVIAPFKEALAAIPAIAMTIHGGNDRERDEFAKKMGEGIFYGAFGFGEKALQSLVTLDPTLLAAMPTEVASALVVPGSRGAGAALRTAATSAKSARSAKVLKGAANIVNPQSPKKGKRVFVDIDDELEVAMSPDQKTYHDSLSSKQQEAYRKKLKESGQVRKVRKTVIENEEAVTNRIGRMLKRGAISGTVALAATADPLVGAAVAAGFASSPELMGILAATSKMFPDAPVWNLAKGIAKKKEDLLTDAKRLAVDASAMTDPKKAVQAAETIEAGSSARGVISNQSNIAASKYDAAPDVSVARSESAPISVQNTMFDFDEKGFSSVGTEGRREFVEAAEAKAALRSTGLSPEKIAKEAQSPALKSVIEKASNKAAKNEPELRKLAGQDVYSPIPQALDGGMSVTVSDPVLKNYHKQIAEQYKKIDPNHPMANAEYLNQLAANAWSSEALMGAFSARARGLLSERLYDAAMNKSAKNVAQFVKNNFEEPLLGWNESRIKRQFRSYIEKKVTDEMSKSIAGGMPVNLSFRIGPGVDDVFSQAKVAAELLQARGNKDFKGIAREAADGFYSTLAKNIEEAAVKGQLADEVYRGMSPVRSATQGVDAYQAMQIMRKGEDPPNIIPFNPSKISGELDYELAAKYGISPEEASSYAAYFNKNYEKASQTVAAAIKDGLRARGVRDLADGSELYVSKGYNSVVDTHLKYINREQSLGKITRAADNFLGKGTTRLLTGSTAAKIANGGSNIGMIASAEGTLPSTIMAQASKELLDLIAANRGGELNVSGLPQVKLTPEKIRRMRALQNADVVNSHMISPDVQRLFSKTKSTKGPLKSASDSFWQIQGETYRLIDVVPKLYLAGKSYDKMLKVLKDLEPGREVAFSLGKNKYIKARVDGQGNVLWGNRRKLLPIDSQETANVIAKTAKQFGNDTLFDMNDMPGGFKKAVNKGLTMSVLNRYMSWQIKSADFFGKKGILSHTIGYDPMNNLITNSPKILKQQAVENAKLMVRKILTQSAHREASKPFLYQHLEEEQKWSNTAALYMYNPYRSGSSENRASRLDLSSMLPVAAAQSVLSIIESGAAQGMRFLGYNEERFNEDKSSLDPMAKARANLYARSKLGKLSNAETLLGLLQMTGGIIGQSIKEGHGGAPKNTGRLVRLFSKMLVGGDLTAAGEALVSYAAGPQTLEYSQRRSYGKMGKEGVEDWSDVFLHQVFRAYARDIMVNKKSNFKKYDYTKMEENFLSTNTGNIRLANNALAKINKKIKSLKPDDLEAGTPLGEARLQLEKRLEALKKERSALKRKLENLYSEFKERYEEQRESLKNKSATK